ncbi:hypothetical protein JOC34_002883 [Virgibacillus halotolerans]|uniref:DUF4352 domain-containing protein n=1 Tax=Virgibacillus halotolerans TaxID=1071053 RepID=UPI00195FB330|nr:DUF4352 domain-containing protein [Virgibacillus halotolerans]MBM7600492.1 hypothetical protein [Virgibacillus halotolerans]
MLRIFTLLSVLMFAILGGLVACSDAPEIEGDKAEAKTGDNAAKKSDKKAEKQAAKEKEADPWTYYEDATWEGDFNGLKTKIEKVVVTEKAPTVEDEKAEESAIGVKFTIENTSDHKFTTYPDQATLVTSTGEQVEADMLISDDLGGDIHEGVIKEGDVLFYLERGEAESVEWIKLEWSETDVELEEAEDYDNAWNTVEVELDLK